MAEIRLQNVSNAPEHPTPVRHCTRQFTDGSFTLLRTTDGGSILRMIAGVERMTDGEILIGEQNVTQLPAAKRPMGILFRQHLLYANRTVAENLKWGLPTARTMAEINEAAALFGVDGLTAFFPKQLTAEQRLRVGLARLLLLAPEVVLLESPLCCLPPSAHPAAWAAILKLYAQMQVTVLCAAGAAETVQMSLSQKEGLDFTGSRAYNR